ncbi:hypothetical protein GCM10010515_20800 [Streptomyces fructofermentans]|uniref:Uncharacterized protein n=1 Tax=Streptomyces fructofermentans TaxID=152141 RepID=A0A918K8V9_9ACTN|nr:hypothetical protein GCM10010515_20800 [Streptomyces fructofermentans]
MCAGPSRGRPPQAGPAPRMFVEWWEKGETHGSLPDAARDTARRAGTRTAPKATTIGVPP